jgi:hypothetical protein
MSSDDTTLNWSELLFPSEIWRPIGELLMPSVTIASFLLMFTVIAYLVLLYVDKTKEIPGAWNPWVIFWVVITTGIVFLVIAWWMSPMKFFGQEVVSSAPNSCVGENGSLEGGLCYKHCRDGFHGFGVRCYANTYGIGIGTVVGLEPCPNGWNSTFLTCNEPITWDNCGFKDLFGTCWPKASGGRIIGRLDNGGVCPGPQDFGDKTIRVDDSWVNAYRRWKASYEKPDPVKGPDGKMESLSEALKQGHKTCEDIAIAKEGEHTEKIDGLCYRKCPADYPNHVPGMPYLCYKGGELSYHRGGGDIPPMFRLLGKYAFNLPPRLQVDNKPI